MLLACPSTEDLVVESLNQNLPFQGENTVMSTCIIEPSKPPKMLLSRNQPSITMVKRLSRRLVDLQV